MKKWYTVYASDGGRYESGSASEAYRWAVAAHARTGGTYECRDENFDLVFVVEA